jgi:hypothetical protein
MDVGMTCNHFYHHKTLIMSSYVEYETLADLTSAVEKLDGREFKGTDVTCVADVCPE